MCAAAFSHRHMNRGSSYRSVGVACSQGVACTCVRSNTRTREGTEAVTVTTFPRYVERIL